MRSCARAGPARPSDRPRPPRASASASNPSRGACVGPVAAVRTRLCRLCLMCTCALRASRLFLRIAAAAAADQAINPRSLPRRRGRRIRISSRCNCATRSHSFGKNPRGESCILDLGASFFLLLLLLTKDLMTKKFLSFDAFSFLHLCFFVSLHFITRRAWDSAVSNFPPPYTVSICLYAYIHFRIIL
jgi:hypothetical protein